MTLTSSLVTHRPSTTVSPTMKAPPAWSLQSFLGLFPSSLNLSMVSSHPLGSDSLRSVSGLSRGLRFVPGGQDGSSVPRRYKRKARLSPGLLVSWLYPGVAHSSVNFSVKLAIIRPPCLLPPLEVLLAQGRCAGTFFSLSSRSSVFAFHSICRLSHSSPRGCQQSCSSPCSRWVPGKRERPGESRASVVACVVCSLLYGLPGSRSRIPLIPRPECTEGLVQRLPCDLAAGVPGHYIAVLPPALVLGRGVRRSCLHHTAAASTAPVAQHLSAIDSCLDGFFVQPNIGYVGVIRQQPNT